MFIWSLHRSVASGIVLLILWLMRLLQNRESHLCELYQAQNSIQRQATVALIVLVFRMIKRSHALTYSHRNMIVEQQEACQKAQQIITRCEELSIKLDPIDWQQDGMQAVVKVNGIVIASLMDLSQRSSEDLLRQIQAKLFERAALNAVSARPGLKALVWSPVDVVQPQPFLSLWVITLETDERIPIIESMSNGQRVYDHYQFDREDGQQLTRLFGPASEGGYHLGDTVTIKVRERQYTGEIIYVIPP